MNKLLRIPVATILFLGCTFALLYVFNTTADSVFGMVGAFACILGLTFSFVLFSNLDIIR